MCSTTEVKRFRGLRWTAEKKRGQMPADHGKPHILHYNWLWIWSQSLVLGSWNGPWSHGEDSLQSLPWGCLERVMDRGETRAEIVHVGDGLSYLNPEWPTLRPGTWAQGPRSWLQVWPEQRFLGGFWLSHLILQRSRWAYKSHREPAGLSPLHPGSSEWEPQYNTTYEFCMFLNFV